MEKERYVSIVNSVIFYASLLISILTLPGTYNILPGSPSVRFGWICAIYIPFYALWGMTHFRYKKNHQGVVYRFIEKASEGQAHRIDAFTP
ncbi:MAG: hypothetical protein U1E36_10190, partial [Rickettsiales bacterium]